jgi:hypothetical protein
MMQFITSHTLSGTIFQLAEPNFVKKMRMDFYNHTATRVDKRLQQGSDQPDLWNCVEESGVLTAGEIYANAELFMIAGSETSCKLLCYNKTPIEALLTVKTSISSYGFDILPYQTSR